MRFDIRQLGSEEFPGLLREIPDAPKELFIRGEMPPESSTFLCVIGSRKTTTYGVEACNKLIEGLAGYDVVIVSGLALGTDANAHRAALKAGLKTIAVPGSGLGEKVLYPRTNYRLAEEILEQGGCLLSEFPEDHQARPENFPQRNRIMAGLSHATLVIEAEVRSGTLITSRLATEYNRDVLTVPGSIFSRSSAGPHMLIRLGATPITSPEELLEALHLEKQDVQLTEHLELSENERKVIALLAEPLSRDELIQHLALPAHEANVMLSAMELKGIIVERMGTIHLT